MIYPSLWRENEAAAGVIKFPAKSPRQNTVKLLNVLNARQFEYCHFQFFNIINFVFGFISCKSKTVIYLIVILLESEIL